MELAGALAIVTGATEGIGRATAFALGRAGAGVAICARTPAKLRATVQELQAAGVDTLLDDRDERAGVKYRDAELVGIPCRISVGPRDLAEGMVEITSRATGEKERVPVEQAVKYVREFLSARRA